MDFLSFALDLVAAEMKLPREHLRPLERKIRQEQGGDRHYIVSVAAMNCQERHAAIRAERQGTGASETRWIPLRKRVEAWDCAVYIVWLETHFELAKKPAKFWTVLEEKVQPAILDLFSAPQETESKAPELQKAVPANANPAAAPAAPQKKHPAPPRHIAPTIGR
jgi:phage terminase large subunit GpA-like protein